MTHNQSTTLKRGRNLIVAVALSLLLPVTASAQPTPTPAQNEAAANKKATPITAVQSEITPGVYDVEIVNTYPHDPQAFTQGLLWYDGSLYESTGQEGRSQVRRVDLETGKILKSSAIPDDQFGEGMTVLGDKMISLTWQDGIVHQWDAGSLKNIRSVSGYSGEGWGLTTHDGELYASDGSDALKVLDPNTFRVVRTIPVRMNGEPISMINELEAIDGYVFANLWTTRYIVGIDPATGNADVIIDLESLPAPQTANPDAVLNGIAWDPATRRMFVTGKLWDKLYEVRLVPKPVNDN